MIITLGTTPALQRTMEFNRLTMNAVNRAHTVRQYASGKSINAARILQTLGIPVLATGFLGGHTGQACREDLERSGIMHRFVVVATSTRMCMTLIDHALGSATELVEEAAKVDDKDYDRLLQTLDELLVGARVLLLCGTLPQQADPGFYRDCLVLARRAGVATIVDTRATPLRLSLSQHPTVVKLNESELSQTVENALADDDSRRRAMQRLVELGAGWVIVTRGAQPTWVCQGDQRWEVSVPKVPVISPIGSGDAFAAGLAAGLVQGQSVLQACRLGTACGAANAMTALAGHANRSEIDRLLKFVEVRELT